MCIILASLVAQMVKMLANTGHQGSNPRSGRSPGEWNSSSPQYSCLESSMDRGTWGATVHEVSNSQTLKD